MFRHPGFANRGTRLDTWKRFRGDIQNQSAAQRVPTASEEYAPDSRPELAGRSGIHLSMSDQAVPHILVSFTKGRTVLRHALIVNGSSPSNLPFSRESNVPEALDRHGAGAAQADGLYLHESELSPKTSSTR
jgi:hypothetical protein